MKSIALAAVILAATPVEAAAHCYSVWKYPFRQRCNEPVRYSRPVARPGRPAAPQPVSLRLPPAESRPEPSVGPDGAIPLPALDFTAGHEPDDETRARLLLRAALGDAHAD
jgi:hypothetical protein